MEELEVEAGCEGKKELATEATSKWSSSNLQRQHIRPLSVPGSPLLQHPPSAVGEGEKKAENRASLA